MVLQATVAQLLKFYNSNYDLKMYDLRFNICSMLFVEKIFGAKTIIRATLNLILFILHVLCLNLWRTWRPHQK
jgi:hypothetical protein